MGLLAAISTCSVFSQDIVRGAAARPAKPDSMPSAGILNAGGREFARGEIIVKLEPGAEQADLNALNRRNGASTKENLPRSAVNVVDLPEDLSVAEAVDRYEASPDVEYAEPDFLLEPLATPSDPFYGNLYGLNNTGQTRGTTDADIDAPEVWNETTGSPVTVVAVIDEGVDINHPDLDSNLWTNVDEVPGDGLDNDHNGYVDDVHGYDFVSDDATVYDPDPVTGRGDEHGTHVAGTIAAEGNNGIGITGVNWDASIMSLKFLGANGGYTSDAVEAINYAVNNGAKISNNSWGGGGKSQALQDAIARAGGAGHLFVTAAGNGGSDSVGDDNDATPFYPASYGNPNIISVAATDDDDRLASFSNFGDVSVDLAAPGVSILSTLPGNSYGRYSGTSMATPHVAGVAALIKSQNPLFDDAQIKARILGYADDRPDLAGKTATGGRLNAFAAISTQAAPNPDLTDPTIGSVKPNARTRDRTPRVRATVRDDRTNLSKSDIRLFLDGKRKIRFSYYEGTDRLAYGSPKLSFGRHFVRVAVTDAEGNATTRRWSFKVVR